MDEARDYMPGLSLLLINKEWFNFRVIGYDINDKGLTVSLICNNCGIKKRITFNKNKIYPLFCTGCKKRNYIDVRLGDKIIDYKLISRHEIIKMRHKDLNIEQ